MSYVYRVKDGADVEVFKELGFDYLPPELYGSEDENNILYKIIQQPLDGQCVKTLIDFYNSIAEKICSDKLIRKAHSKMGIKFRWQKGKYKLVLNPIMLKMFRLWRLEIDFETGDIYFTISDGNMPRFYDAEQVIETYCKEDIETLVLNNVVEKVALTQ